MIRQGISLRWVIFLSFIVSTLLGALLVGVLGLKLSSDALVIVNHEIRKEINVRIEERLADFFRVPEQILQGNKSRMLRGDLEVTNQEQLVVNFLHQVELFPAVSSIYFGNALGGIANAGREGTGGFYYQIRTENFAPGQFTKIAVDSSSLDEPPLLTLPEFDARLRPWYTNALETERIAWSAPYQLFTGQDTAITSSTSVRDSNGDLLGILAVDLFLSDLSIYLQGMYEKEVRQCLILGPGGEIIASSRGESPFRRDAQGAFRPILAVESDDPLTRILGEELKTPHTQEEDPVYFENRRYYIETLTLPYPEGLGWTIATLMPEHEIIGEVLSSVRTTLLILSLLLLVVFIISSYIAKKIASPLSRLTSVAQTLAAGDWSIEFTDPSRITEIGILSKSFFQMLKKLQETIQDLTEEVVERKAIQAQLTLAKDEALEASKIKTQFVANMSHELRTPLNAVLGFTELLGDYPMIPEQQSYLELARKAGKNLMTLIGDLLDFSKIEAGIVDLKMEPTDLLKVLDDIIAILSVNAREKGLDFWVEYHSPLPSKIWVDSERLQQILLNLLNNGIKFTPKGSVILRVDFRTDKPEVGTLSFSVQDTGIGIPENQLPKLFKPFSQVDSTQSRAYGGTGLGLLISQLLVQAMGSDIDVSSSLGNGTCFAFSLEVKYQDDVSKPSQDSPVVPMTLVDDSSPSKSESHVPRILLAEDVEMNRILIRGMLNKIYTHYELVNAADGVETVREFSSKVPDLILMDVQMPNLDGKDATRAIRKLEAESASTKRVPIIALTASATAQEQQECYQSGMDDFLSKPVFFQTLQEKILLWIGNSTKKSSGSK
ncbi:MAG: response regulator [Spirochaetales bacterium]|nr:response regulator [Spirochaetales bacterium]